ncbi:MAG: CDP-archaeol synthase [Rhizobiales bacterium]|nr:CDP-archaeol synthase [Hyphomicrobiales bacterium]
MSKSIDNKVGSQLETSQARGPGLGWSRELTLRVLSAAALMPIVLLITVLGVEPFAVLVAGGAAVLAWEWGELVRGANDLRDRAFQAQAVLTAIAAGLVAGGLPVEGLVVVVATAALVAGLSIGRRPGLSALGVLYVALPAIALVWLRSDPGYGLAAVLLILAVVWATDSAALVCGRLIGGPRLAPRISPHKTWAGFIGGLASGVLTSNLFLFGMGGPTSIWVATAIGALLSLSTLMGDLLESAIKRNFNRKDISGLIPGHGGLLDRVDGLMIAALTAAVVASLVNGLLPGRALFVWPAVL